LCIAYLVFSLAILHNLICSSDTKGARTNKNKKKNRRRKDQSKDSSLNNVNGNHNKVGTSLSLSVCLFMHVYTCMCINNEILYFFLCIIILFALNEVNILNVELLVS
jgi:hypothetical protein